MNPRAWSNKSLILMVSLLLVILLGCGGETTPADSPETSPTTIVQATSVPPEAVATPTDTPTNQTATAAPEVTESPAASEQPAAPDTSVNNEPPATPTPVPATPTPVPAPVPTSLTISEIEVGAGSVTELEPAATAWSAWLPIWWASRSNT